MPTLKIFTGNANPNLARDVAAYLDAEVGKADVATFSDGEVNVEINENVRGRDCFVLQSTCVPANTHLMELLIMIDALRRSSARRVTAVVPYYGYARQDRKVLPRAPITAKLVADLIVTAGTDRMLCIDLHAGQIQGFFNIPVDNLYASPILLPHIREKFRNELVIISPDAGGVPRARAYASRLHAGLALIDKRRAEANQAEAMHLIGEVENKTALILDDMVDTAGTLVEAARTLIDHGASGVHACCTHAILSGPAIERLAQSPFGSVVVTDTLPNRPERENLANLKVLSSARLFSEAIKSIHNEDSISRLFELQH